MTEQDHFSIPEEYYKKLSAILKEKAKCGHKSRWICETLIKGYQEETKGEKMDSFIYEDSLVNLPKVWEVLETHHLKQLTPKDFGRLYKTIAYNHNLVKEFFENHYSASLHEMEAV